METKNNWLLLWFCQLYKYTVNINNGCANTPLAIYPFPILVTQIYIWIKHKIKEKRVENNSIKDKWIKERKKEQWSKRETKRGN